MLARAGLGIAFNAKPIVQRQAQASINMHDLKLILYFLGINRDDLQELNELVGKSVIQSWPKKNKTT
jgi:phosphoserine phosphatase